MNRSVLAIGDVESPSCHGGIPHAFLNAARHGEFAQRGGRIRLNEFKARRISWTVNRMIRGHRMGGYQYSSAFLQHAENAVKELIKGDVISFSQHFPRAQTVRDAGGSITYYLDATAAQLTSGRGLDVRLPNDIRQTLLDIERQNYSLADRIVFRSRWAADSAIKDCGASPTKVHVVLPGANLDLPEDWSFLAPTGRPGFDRPAVLGFVGKDWKRKGLPLICDVRDELERRGLPAIVRAAGTIPDSIGQRSGVDLSGYIDKKSDPTAYPRFLSECDLGCLFSSREALGFSIIEFLRAGVPVIGFAAEGPAETIPSDAGLRFSPENDVLTIADAVESLLRDESRMCDFRRAAQEHSFSLTWDRCIAEFKRLWAGKELVPFRLVSSKTAERIA
ncbi:glycosyltransferase family 4 protein [Rhodopirellula baltica]|uniref:Similar to hexosyltransferase n=1 Tax=Rhodopirellula baltica (strain DSM 10527 / NCIMB 13988 / SH1) TaxID=243090 RepID=Q7UVR5_RHOBA|nr:glycosyltransferase family 4 protein [Rhodopirellula baltica]CAD72657.1 similar to hexosyltransferase [Rhodopirellula baltica SH 1]